MRRNTLFWGTVLIILGVLQLLNNLGILQISVWQVAWPLLLIAFGIWVLLGTILRRSPGQAEQVSIPLETAGRARIQIQHAAGRLSLAGKTGPGVLLDGTFGGGLNHSSRMDGDTLVVDMRVPEGYFPWGWGPRDTLDWNFRLSEAIPLTLDFNTGASESQIDLSGLRVPELSLQTGASSTDITLPAAAGMTHMKVGSGAASVNIKVPHGVAARIRAQGGLASIVIDQTRFPRQGELYLSPDYDSAPNKVDIDVQTGVGAVDIR
jgi:hypothetical protein